MASLIEHLEAFLGTTSGGWQPPEWSFSVMEFPHGPIDDCTVFVTLGLSDVPLPSHVSAKEIRHELMVAVNRKDVPPYLPSLLEQVGKEAVDRRSAFLRGDVIGPRGPLFEGSDLTAFYASAPSLLPDEFGTCSAEDGTDRIFAWLIPITTREASFVQAQGWNAFEVRLAKSDADLFDLRRSSIL
jgi:hypothetical protein